MIRSKRGSTAIEIILYGPLLVTFFVCIADVGLTFAERSDKLNKLREIIKEEREVPNYQKKVSEIFEKLNSQITNNGGDLCVSVARVNRRGGLYTPSIISQRFTSKLNCRDEISNNISSLVDRGGFNPDLYNRESELKGLENDSFLVFFVKIDAKFTGITSIILDKILEERSRYQEVIFREIVGNEHNA